MIIKDAFIQQVNVAYDTLSDPEARLKYDYELFGSSSSSTSGSTGGSNYVRMTAADVDQMFSGLNTFERFTTAQYHALRSAKAPASIGRRRTNFAERKAFRAAATPLPSKSASMGWLAFPLLVAGIWGYNLSSVKNNARR
jgi:DnaJ-class molecular chaperone